MHRIHTLFLILLFACSEGSWGQAPWRLLRVMGYNVENLYDTEDDPDTMDEGFTPEGPYHWTPARYRLKLEHIAQVISAVGDEDFPDVVGLVEVENEQVLDDLLTKTTLGRQAGYRYVLTHGEDRRGIQVALLYRPSAFRLVAKEELPLHFPFDPTKRTRALLHATGIVGSGDTLDVVVCHLPSRRGGAGASAPYRTYAAQRLRQLVDSLMAGEGQHRHCLLLGDFNGEAEEPFLRETLGVIAYTGQVGSSVKRAGLYALLHRGTGAQVPGSYCFQGGWSQLDQLILSGSLLQPSSSLRYVAGSAETVRLPFFITKQGQPWRTYGGTFYRGGYSDHFPTRLRLSY